MSLKDFCPAALQRSLVKLAEEPIEAIHRAAPLRAFYLDGLIHPDNVKNVLRWLNDPEGYRDECSDQEWAAFVALSENHYDFQPDRDSPVTAAEKLDLQVSVERAKCRRCFYGDYTVRRDRNSQRMLRRRSVGPVQFLRN